MALKDLINEFNLKKNSDFILEKNGQFLIAEEVDSFLARDAEKDLVNSYEQYIIEKLPERLRNYIESKYEKFGTYSYKSKEYSISNIPEDTENRYKRIFYYVEIPLQQLKAIKKPVIPLQDESAIKSSIVSALDFTPENNDSKIITNKTVSVLDNEELEWQLVCFEEQEKTKPINTAIDKILKLSSKKGQWILKNDQIRKSSKDDLNSISTNDDPNLLLKNLEESLIKLYDDNFSDNTPTKLIAGSDVLQTNLAIFYKFYIHQTTQKKKYLVGFPKKLIDKFPNLSLALDYEKFIPQQIATYDSIEDLTKTIDELRKNIQKKQESLSKTSFEVSNYDPLYYVTNLQDFILEIDDSFKKNKFEKTSKITFELVKTKCDRILEGVTDLTLLSPQKKAEYNNCNKEFVDLQTNLALKNIKIGDKQNFTAFQSLKIDNSLSSYFLTNAKTINKLFSSYSAKNFFAELIYKKTQFVREEKLDIYKTFLDAAEQSYQQSYITNPKNLVKYSLIKQKIARINFSQKSLSQNISDVLATINSLKKLYENILYRYDLKDVVDELLACFLVSNPELNKKGSETLVFLGKLVELIDYQNLENVKTFATCTGINTGPALNKESIENALYDGLQQTLQFFSSQDKFITTVIKCYNEVYPNAATDFINEYVKSEQIRADLKKQYQQLVVEAKLYKPAPGSEDSMKRTAAAKKTFLKKAIRNAWILLQQQAEAEAEKIIRQTAIELIRSLLKDLNKCKPDNSKDQNKNKPLGNAGDLLINTGGIDNIDSLLAELSGLFAPDLLCSLFYGSASEDILENVLLLIQEKYPQLYSIQEPIKFNNVIVSEVGLTSVFIIKQFFINIAINFPALTTNKCDSFFAENSFSPLLIDDDEKCIDFSENYLKRKREELINSGFTEEQANAIIENDKKVQTDKYEQLQKFKENGIYNEITDKLDKKVQAASLMVKEKIDKEIANTCNTFVEFINSFKNELVSIIKKFQIVYQVEKYNFDYNATEGNLILKNTTINFKLDSNQKINLVFKYEKNVQDLNVLIKSEKYDILYNNQTANMKEGFKQLLIKSVKNNNVTSKIFDFNDTLDNKTSLSEGFLVVPLINSLQYYSDNIFNSLKEGVTKFENTNTDNEINVVQDVREFVFFEDK